ncbi:nucleotidyltransferase family protein [Rhodobium gokarnense]|uniref:NDP-sugar pyrophosphorylase family protein n=1 Tax=Rhodobium gokarnense TaxID=364296 RepID=A0ABT3HHS0_9HYPH|nr:sugar phosphate nucleotidyltransferase [Rhodobium gokarnense]MCW2309948.1 NDP-sugar pyrophosphorylase family protein [Rhodobium gokarnense]
MPCNRIVILAGGKGTRLRPFTATFPKPLVPVGDKPILEVLLRQLSAQGFNDVTLTLGHLAEFFRAFIGQHKTLAEKINFSFVEEEAPTGTAGSLASVPNLDSTFMVMNGDLLTDLNFRDLCDAHQASGAALTIAAHSKKTKIDLGILEADDNGVLTNYIEKPEHTHTVSMGVYVYEPRVLNYIEKDQYLDFPDLVLKLLDAGEKVRIHKSDAFWLDIGRPDDYALAQDIFEQDPMRFSCGA